MMSENSALSVITLSLRSSPLSYAEKLKRLTQMGIGVIQDGFQPNMTLQQQKAVLEEHGVSLSVFSCWSMEDLQQNPGKYIEACHAFHCDELMLGFLPTEMRESQAGYARAAEAMNAIGRQLQPEGIYLTLHNHAQEFRRYANGITGIQTMLEAMDPTVAGFLLDTYWVQAGGGDILAWLNLCKGRMRSLHVKDYAIAPASYTTEIGSVPVRFAPVGGGNMPWPEIIHTAKECGIGRFIIEQDNSYERDIFDCILESKRTMNACGVA